MNITEHTPQAKAAAPSAELIAWLEAVFSGLMRSVGTCQVALGPRAWPLYLRLQRARNRITRLLAQLAALIAAGKSPGGPKPPRHPPSGGPKPRPMIPREQRIPRGRAWLAGALDHHARAHASHLNGILANPEWVAAIAQSPGVVRTLRAYGHLLGIDLPASLRLPPRPIRSRPSKPRPIKTGPRRGTPHLLPGDRPIPDYVMAAARAWKRRDARRAARMRDSKTG